MFPILGWTTIGVSLAAAGLGVMLLLANAKVDVITAQRDLEIKNRVTVESAMETQTNAFINLKEIEAAGRDRETNLEQSNQAIRKEKEMLDDKINSLRITEEREARLAPFNRGLAAHSRLDSIMQQFSSDRDIEDRDVSGTTSTNNKIGTPVQSGKDTNSSSSDDGERE